MVALSALVLSGCFPSLEEKLIQEGIGTELPAEDTAQATARLDIYLDYLCQQAGMTRFAGEGVPAACDMKSYGAVAWTLLVKAGFNDIDRRCDAYLGWLNARRRDRNAILSQIHDTRTFTEALLYTTSAGATPIAITGLAFGLASNTFTNYYSRLILEVEKSTVEIVVHEKRLQYRDKLNVAIAYQPDAVHVLREYLLICTPFFIENLINQRTRDSIAGNTPADRNNPEQIRKSMVSTALLNAIPRGPREPLLGVDPTRPLPVIEPKMSGGLNDIEKAIPRSIGESIQANLCVTPSGSFDVATREAIRLAKVGGNRSGASASPFTNAKSEITTAVETQTFLGSKPCSVDMTNVDRGYQTAYEKFRFADEVAVRSLQTMLANCDPNLKDKGTGKFDVATRTAIKLAKSKVVGTPLSDAGTETLTDKSYIAVSLVCRPT
jgi:hypothetical protein